MDIIKNNNFDDTLLYTAIRWNESLSEISKQIKKFCKKHYKNSESDNLVLVLKELQSEVNLPRKQNDRA